MLDYYTNQILLALLLLVVMTVITLSNSNFNRQTRCGFIVTYMFIIVGALCEYAENMYGGKWLIGNEAVDIALHTTFKIIELTIVPVIPLVFSRMVFESEIKKNVFGAVEKLIVAVYIGFEVFSLGKGGLIFSIDEANVFHREKFYNVYPTVFVLTSIYMFTNAVRFCRAFQSKKILELTTIVTFIAIGVTMQFANPMAMSRWLAVAISTALFFIYYNEVVQYADSLTKLLNQKSYYNYLDSNSEETVAILTFDVDDFEQINGTEGHYFGDVILTKVAMAIKKNYGRYGKCYRIGGDKFAVILEKKIANVDTLNASFEEKIRKQKDIDKKFPDISYGIACYNPDNKDTYNLHDVARESNENMYKNKKMKKEGV